MWIPAATEVEAEAAPATLPRRTRAKSTLRVLFMKSTMMAPRRFLDSARCVHSLRISGAVTRNIGQELCQLLFPGGFGGGTPVGPLRRTEVGWGGDGGPRSRLPF